MDESHPLHCSNLREEDIIIYNTIVPGTYALSAISMAPGLLVYCMQYPKLDYDTSKSLFWPGLILFITILLFLITFAITATIVCHNENLYLMLLGMSCTLYFLQSSIYLQILFARLFIIFRESYYKLSKWTITAWIIYFILISISFIGGAILFLIYPSEFPLTQYAIWIISVSGSFSALSAVWLVGLFLYKMICVQKSMQAVNNFSQRRSTDRIISLMTKTSVLCFISMFMYLLTTALGPLLAFKSVYLHLTWRIIIVANVYTNFLCILLLQPYFNGYYSKLCGCFDLCCNSMWSKCFGRTEDSGYITEEIELVDKYYD